MLQHPSDQGVAGLVVGHHRLLLPVHDAGLLLCAGHHPLDGVLQVGDFDVLLQVPGRVQGGLVHQVGKVGAREAWRVVIR